MEIVSFSIGLIGLLITAITLYRTKKNATMIRIHLAKLSGKVSTIKHNANWANTHYEIIRKCLEDDDWTKSKKEASISVQKGGRDAGAAARISHELLRDVRSIQLSIFGKVEHLQSNGKLVLLSGTDPESK